MNLLIRKAVYEDKDILNNMFQKLLEYERDSFGSNVRDNLKITSFFDKRIDDDNNIILVALVDNIIVGFTYVSIDFDNKITKDIEAKGESIFIEAEYRNKKIGSRLINEVIEILKRRNVKYFSLENFYDNDSAKYLYKKLGFEVVLEHRRKEIL